MALHLTDSEKETIKNALTMAADFYEDQVEKADFLGTGATKWTERIECCSSILKKINE